MRRMGWILGLLAAITMFVHAADAPVTLQVWANGEPVPAKVRIMADENGLLLELPPILSAVGFSVRRAAGSGELLARRGTDELSLLADSRWGRWRGRRIELIRPPRLQSQAFYASPDILSAIGLAIRDEQSPAERNIYIYEFLPQLPANLHNPDFWINRVPNPTAVIAAGQTLTDINRNNYRAGIYTVWEDLPDTIAPEQWSTLSKQLPPWDSTPLYDAAGKLLKPEMIAKIRQDMNLPAPNQPTPVTFGLIVQGCLLRGAPRDDIFTVEPGALDFDELQVSSLELGSGVAVVSVSRDGGWVLIDSPFGWGWVERESVAISPSKVAVLDYCESGPRLVVVGDRTMIGTKDKYLIAQMGDDFPIIRREQNAYIVKIPQRAADGRLQWIEGRIADNDLVREGYLPFTQANLFKQAFKLIGEPYAWGDQRRGLQGRDCSRFVADVFRSMGVILPRNSYEQDKSGVSVLRFTSRMAPDERLRLLNSLTPCGTVLALKGHIMIYLGSVDGTPYVIHALYAYRVPGDKGDIAVKTNRVLVSRLDLGANTKRRSFLERLTAAVEVGSLP